MLNLDKINTQIQGDNSSRLQEQKRNFESFREETIYLLSIAVHQGVGTRKLAWQHLGVKPETVASLRENNISPPTITVFQGLAKKASQLNAIKERIQRRYMVYAQPYWFVRENDLEQAAEEIFELRQTCDQLRAEALNDYERERDSYVVKITNVCISAGILEVELENVVAHYLDYFPSPEKVAQDFRVEFNGPVPVPSFREQTAQDALLAESQNRLNEANIIQQLQLEYTSHVRAKFSEAISEAQDEIYGILAEQLTKLEELGNKEINKRTQLTLQKAVERLSVLIGYEEGLQGIADSFSSIVHSSKNLNQRRELFRQISNLKTQLHNEINLISSSGKGHKALAQWMLEIK